MFSKFIQTAFTGTSLAPILLTMSLVTAKQSPNIWDSLILFLSGFLLLVFSLIIINCASTHLETFSVNLTSIKIADDHAVIFLVSCFLPLTSENAFAFNSSITLYTLTLLSLVIYNSNYIYFNPLLRLFGYHLLEVTTGNNETYFLFTDRTIRSVPLKNIKVVRIAEYVIMERIPCYD